LISLAVKALLNICRYCQTCESIFQKSDYYITTSPYKNNRVATPFWLL